METKRYIILSILSITVSLQTLFAQSNSNSEYYDKAYSEITDMLEGRTALSIRRAVFVAEWAYLDGNLDYEKDFCEPIKKGADYLMRMIAVNHWEKYKTAKQIALCNFFFYPCSGNGQQPYEYDFSNEFPKDDWRYQLVSRTIKTHKGQCHSLPWAFKLYAEELGAIVNDSATDYYWNIGGGTKRDAFIRTNNFLFGIDPKIHGFKTYYYGVGTLRR